MRRALRKACLLATLTMLAALAPAAPGLAAPASKCTAATSRAALASFVTAFNRGDSEELDDLFATAPAFRWYSSPSPGQRLGAKARNRATLIPYLSRRHGLGDRLYLASFQFNGNWGGYGNFEFAVRRRVEGFRAGDWFRVSAKGAAICDEDAARLIVLSFGPAAPPA